jgi:hypothetical protein
VEQSPVLYSACGTESCAVFASQETSRGTEATVARRRPASVEFCSHGISQFPSTGAPEVISCPLAAALESDLSILPPSPSSLYNFIFSSSIFIYRLVSFSLSILIELDLRYTPAASAFLFFCQTTLLLSFRNFQVRFRIKGGTGVRKVAIKIRRLSRTLLNDAISYTEFT